MLRQIITSDKKEFVLTLPDDLVGKVVEVIAFEIDEVEPKETSISKEAKVSRLNDLLKDFTINSGGYKFDRAEANDYE